MPAPAYSWPEDLFPSDLVRSWLGSELGSDVVGPIRVLYVKQWGVTAAFTDTRFDRRVIFKGSRHPVAAHGPIVHRFLAETVPEHVPAVFASRIHEDTSWTVFESIEGESLEDHLDQTRFVELASSLAAIQVAASEAVIPAGIPRSPLRALPDTLDRFAESIERHRDQWESQGSGPQAASARDAVGLIMSIRPRVVATVEELGDAGWPNSIDHVDLNVSNALVRDDQLVLIDWEEAIVGFPAFSLDRLLGDAQEYDDWGGEGPSPTGEALIGAYADRVPWGDPHLRRTVIEKAIRLNRIAFAGQMLDFWRAQGRDQEHPQLMAFCTDRILEAWTNGRE